MVAPSTGVHPQQSMISMLTPGIVALNTTGSVQQVSTPSTPQAPVLQPVHTQFHPPHVLVPANPYLHEEIPIWLRVYFKASPSLDHHLKWDLFRLPELECFEAMLTRLFRDELEELVMRYEAMRITLMQEMEQRVNVQLVEQHPHYYQGATISEIEDCSATAVASVASVEDAHHLSSSNASCKQETSAFTSGIVLPRTTSSSSPGI